MQSVTIKIKGMTCMGCVNSVKTVLTNVPGVTQVEATLEPAQAVVRFDSSITSLNQLENAVNDAGFEVIH